MNSEKCPYCSGPHEWRECAFYKKAVGIYPDWGQTRSECAHRLALESKLAAAKAKVKELEEKYDYALERAIHPVGAIWLRRDGERVKVLIEVKDSFVEIIDEVVDSPFSHIIERAGIERRLKGKKA